MKKTDTASVLEFLSLTDNRKVNEDMILAWHDAIGHLDFDLAKSAVTLAVQDDSISWVVPRHVLGKSKLVLQQREHEAYLSKPLPVSVPGQDMPKCEHGLGLLFCVPCCKALKK